MLGVEGTGMSDRMEKWLMRVVIVAAGTAGVLITFGVVVKVLIAFGVIK